MGVSNNKDGLSKMLRPLMIALLKIIFGKSLDSHQKLNLKGQDLE